MSEENEVVEPVVEIPAENNVAEPSEKDIIRQRYQKRLPFLIRALNKFNRQNKIDGTWNGLDIWQVAKLYEQLEKKPDLLWLDGEIGRLGKK